jgi:bifunctional DNA-binding transcriptional regulator/antitoxin component of YhaV-PrlF toxin-antitoxin module
MEVNLDKKLRILMRQREKANESFNLAYQGIISYLREELGAKPTDILRAYELKETYIISHLAKALSIMNHDEQDRFDSLDELARHILAKKCNLARANSSEYRTKEEERAYGSARKSWHDIQKEAGIR